MITLIKHSSNGLKQRSVGDYFKMRFAKAAPAARKLSKIGKRVAIPAAVGGLVAMGVRNRFKKHTKVEASHELLFAKLDLILGREELELGLIAHMAVKTAATLGTAGVVGAGIKNYIKRRDAKSIAKGMQKNTIGKRLLGYGLLSSGIPRPKSLRKYVAPKIPKQPSTPVNLSLSGPYSAEVSSDQSDKLYDYTDTHRVLAKHYMHNGHSVEDAINKAHTFLKRKKKKGMKFSRDSLSLSAFDRLAAKLKSKGESQHEAKAVAGIVGRRKYDKAGMERKALAGKRKKMVANVVGHSNPKSNSVRNAVASLSLSLRGKPEFNATHNFNVSPRQTTPVKKGKFFIKKALKSTTNIGKLASKHQNLITGTAVLGVAGYAAKKLYGAVRPTKQVPTPKKRIALSLASVKSFVKSAAKASKGSFVKGAQHGFRRAKRINEVNKFRSKIPFGEGIRQSGKLIRRNRGLLTKATIGVAKAAGIGAVGFGVGKLAQHALIKYGSERLGIKPKQELSLAMPDKTFEQYANSVLVLDATSRSKE